VAIRVKGLAGAGLHTENRVPCGASNPYLVGAAAIAARAEGAPDGGGLGGSTQPPNNPWILITHTQHLALRLGRRGWGRGWGGTLDAELG
jgi:hypothetical protein